MGARVLSKSTFVGAAFSRPHHGWAILYFSWGFPYLANMLIPIVEISVNALSRGYSWEGILGVARLAIADVAPAVLVLHRILLHTPR